MELRSPLGKRGRSPLIEYKRSHPVSGARTSVQILIVARWSRLFIMVGSNSKGAGTLLAVLLNTT